MSLELESNGHQNNLKEVKLPDPEVYEFEGFLLDASHLMLYRSGGEEDLPMTPKQVETLLALVERSGEIVAKDALMDRLWPNAFVEESNLIQNIHILRKTLGETADGKPMIETLRRRGYRFNGELKAHVRLRTEIAPHDPPEESAALFKFPTVVTDKVIADTASVSDSSFKKKIFAAGTVVLLLAGAFVVAFYFYASQPVAVGGKRSIAVLPLKPINTATRDEFYENGIADSLIIKLGSMKGLVARPLSATRKYADIEQDAITAGKEQQVDYVLASNYQLADGKIKITSQLINVASGQIEESYNFEKEALSVFAIQDAVAAEFGSKLMTRFGGTGIDPATRRGTANEEAYRLYLQGMILYDQRGKAVKKAIENLDEAVTLDPNYALAWAGLAHAHRAAINNVNDVDINEERQKSEEAFTKALELDPNLSEAYSAICAFNENDFAAKERACRRALELDPNSSLAHNLYSSFLVGRGRFDEAIAEIKTAIELDPTSYFNQRIYANDLYFARRYEEAVAQYKRLIEMDEQKPATYNWLIRTLEAQGNESEAFEWFIRALTLAKRDDKTIQRFKTAYQRSGWRGVLLEKERGGGNDGGYFRRAGWNARLGNKDKAFEYLEKSYQEDARGMGSLQVEPQFDSLRDDPRFDELVKRVGLK